ncbi:sulfotransferase family protein [Streptomyces sp. NPDC001795]|uniref:sulfotransferase family protein n=1 Tax=unclassified Streptomyces TaxID=2593676 RepID=UPI00332E62BC
MLEVIGAGLGRTGTYSLKEALTHLGYGPCHHMTSLGEDRRLRGGWEAVVRGEKVEWSALFEGYRSSVDWPACAFWRELTVAHPDARVILTVRDPDRWYASMRSTLYRSSHPPRLGVEGLMMWLEDRFDPDLRRRRRISREVIWQGAFGGRFEDRDHAIETFQRHNAEVQAQVPDDRLLVFDVAAGWEPLCAFLGVPVPDEPFPHLNQAVAFQEGLSRRRRRILTGRGPIGASGDAVR